MRLLRLVVGLALLGLLVAVSSLAQAAEAPKNKGLLISPLRQYVDVRAGTQKSGSFTVANLTDKPMTVTLSVKQFSVSDYAYNYSFSPPNTWLSLSRTLIALQPNESSEVGFAITVPPGTAGGGQYYTLLASANYGAGGLESTVQAATLLYLTVEGKLITSSQLVSGSINRITFGKQFHYTIAVRNTGNVHYFAYFAGQLHGLTTHGVSGSSHLLLPHAIRLITGDIPVPILPGLYRAEYGYRTDAGTTIMRSSYVLFLPPWSLAFAGLVLLIVLNLHGRRSTHDEPKGAAKSKSPETKNPDAETARKA